MWGAARRGLSLLGRAQRRRLALVGMVAVAVSVLEIISAGMIFVLMRLVLDPGVIPELPLVGRLQDHVPGLTYEQAAGWFAGAFAVFFVFRSGVFLAQQHILARITENQGVMLADRLFHGYLTLPYSFHLQRNSAEIMRNAYDNVAQVVNSVYRPVVTVFAELVLVVAMLGVLLVLSPLTTLGAAVLLGSSMVVSHRFVQPRLRALGAKRQEAAGRAIQHLQQGIGGIRDVKVLGKEWVFSRLFKSARATMARSQYWRVTYAFIPRLALEAAFFGLILVVLVAAVSSGEVTSVLSTLGLFAYAGVRLQPSLERISGSLTSLRYAEAAVDELVEDLALLDRQPVVATRGQGTPTPLPFTSEIHFDSVAFAYEGADLPALHAVDLRIAHGESVGISGHTGSGKTTFLDLLCGLLVPTDGRILVDGEDISGRLREWQRNIGFVHQTSFLIDDTLRANIAFGVPEKDVDEDRVLEALQIAELADLIEELPHGLGTVVGERGLRLSGGQRQRVTLARAIYRKPSVLVLDEGTSALDNITEAKVIRNLERFHGEMTVVMVAHRLTTIARCDRIFYFEHGRLAAAAPYEQLLDEHDGFQRLASGAS